MFVLDTKLSVKFRRRPWSICVSNRYVLPFPPLAMIADKIKSCPNKHQVAILYQEHTGTLIVWYRVVSSRT